MFPTLRSVRGRTVVVRRTVRSMLARRAEIFSSGVSRLQLPPRGGLSSRSNAVLLWVACGLALVIAIECRDFISEALRHDEVDFGVYRAGGLALARGADVYAIHVGALRLPFTYPPAAAVLFAPLAAFDMRQAQAVWAVGSIIALWYVVRLSLRRYATSAVGGSLLATAAVFVVVAHSNPVRVGMWQGQINVFLLLLILADFCGCFRSLPRGSLIGLAAALKLTPAFLIVYLLVVRRFRAAAVAAATFLSVALAAVAAGPSTSWRYWFHGYFANAPRAGDLQYISNQSLHGLLVRLTGDPDRARLLWLSAAVLTAIAVLWAARRAHAERPWLAEALAMAGIVLISPLSWVHHWILVLPLLIASSRYAAEAPARLRIALASTTLALSAVLLYGVVWKVPIDNDQVYRANVWQFLVGNSQVLLLLVLVLLVTGRLVGERRPGSAQLSLDRLHDRV